MRRVTNVVSNIIVVVVVVVIVGGVNTFHNAPKLLMAYTHTHAHTLAYTHTRTHLTHVPCPAGQSVFGAFCYGLLLLLLLFL